jgi:hypothetical protein
MAIDGFHVTPKNVFMLLKGDDTPGHMISIKCRREGVQHVIETVLVRVSAKELAERRRIEFQRAKEKREAEEAFEKTRVQRELYAAKVSVPMLACCSATPLARTRAFARVRHNKACLCSLAYACLLACVLACLRQGTLVATSIAMPGLGRWCHKSARALGQRASAARFRV